MSLKIETCAGDTRVQSKVFDGVSAVVRILTPKQGAEMDMELAPIRQKLWVEQTMVAPILKAIGWESIIKECGADDASMRMADGESHEEWERRTAEANRKALKMRNEAIATRPNAREDLERLAECTAKEQELTDAAVRVRLKHCVVSIDGDIEVDGTAITTVDELLAATDHGEIALLAAELNARCDELNRMSEKDKKNLLSPTTGSGHEVGERRPSGSAVAA